MLVLKFGLVGGGGAYIHARRRAGSRHTLFSISPLLDFEAVEPRSCHTNTQFEFCRGGR
jgi:hypothetical protein